jgi:hypothetical protein
LAGPFQELQQRNGDILAEIYPDPIRRREARAVIAAAASEWRDFKSKARDGRVDRYDVGGRTSFDGTSVSIGQNISERKRAEEERKRLLATAHDCSRGRAALSLA